ncbi:MAG: leucine-rich repeat protein [Bacteroides sp.]|nr:leucine-rich repeat protein [Bacteroides sp.]
MRPNFFKILFIFFALIFPSFIYSASIEVDGLLYTISGTSATLTGYSKSKSLNDLIIPGKIDINGKSYSVTTIGERAFRGAELKGSLKIGEGIVVIKDEAFQNTPVTELYLPSTLRSIGYNALDVRYGILHYFECRAVIPPKPLTTGYVFFNDIFKLNTELRVPEQSIESYKNAWGWGFSKTTSLPIVEKIELSNDDILLNIGDSKHLTATIFPSCISNSEIKWSSKNPLIATVDSEGTIVAVSEGDTEIVATINDVSASCHVSVHRIMAEAIILNVNYLDIIVGQREQLTATILPANVTDANVSWHTSDETVAIVNDEGIVTGKSIGEAYITATCDDASTVCYVKVSPELASSIGIIGDSNPNEWFILTQEGVDINMKADCDITISVYTLDGKIVYSKSIDKGKIIKDKLTRNSLKAGLYIVTVQGSNCFESKEFIVR